MCLDDRYLMRRPGGSVVGPRPRDSGAGISQVRAVDPQRVYARPTTFNP